MNAGHSATAHLVPLTEDVAEATTVLGHGKSIRLVPGDADEAEVGDIGQTDVSGRLELTADQTPERITPSE